MLSQMRAGQRGKIVQINGGPGLAARLSALGIRPGKRITKTSSMLMRGPVTIQSDSTRLAVGFGMAAKIIVELDQ
jgi:ferrous iron transport protein A